jgi:hypothetical protein
MITSASVMLFTCCLNCLKVALNKNKHTKILNTIFNVSGIVAILSLFLITIIGMIALVVYIIV